MLTSIKLQNFKCFRDLTEVPLSKLNLFTGVNGKGKSTVIQSLLLIRQSSEINRVTQNIFFNGSCVELGTFNDVKNIDIPTKEPIILGYTFRTDDGEYNICYKLISDDLDDMSALLSEVTICGSYKTEPFNVEIYKVGDRHKFSHNGKRRPMRWSDLLFNKEVAGNDLQLKYVKFITNLTKIHYVSADRLGPQDYYFKSNLPRFTTVGNKGQYTATILAKKKTEPVIYELCIEDYPQTVLDQTEAWLNKIFGGGKINIKTIEASIVLLQMNSSNSRQLFKPINVGFGYSYILPIVVSSLIAQKGSILIIENPEAHLHPRAQSQLIKFLARVASTGVQVIVESHSDHILNGLRVAVVDGEIPLTYTDVKVAYFDGSDNYFKEVPIHSDGSITSWPEDFFDQTDKDFRLLFGM